MRSRFSKRSDRPRGFTLVEVVAVMVIAGILSVTAIGVFRRSTWDARAASDTVRATLGYAQKTAIGARRGVRVTRTGDTLDWAICTAPVGTDDLCPTAGSAWTALNGPTGASTWTAPAGVTLGGFTTLHFDSVGRPVDAAGVAVTEQTLTLTGADLAVTLTISEETGHVR